LTASLLSDRRLSIAEQLHRTPLALYMSCPLNLSGHPALVMPNGRTDAGLPTAVQIIGPKGGESACVSVGLALEIA
jgi:Asp-tRNA(Asn)/Glu-tRNA(Gln) amidotransferase A subunit family amidase